MKIVVSTLFVAFSLVGWSQTKVSVSDGDWNDPTTWSPASVPYLNEDTVIVNHEVTTLPDTEVGINHLIISTDGIVEGTGTFALHGSIEIDGEFSVDTLVIGDGDYFINNGLIEVNAFTTTNLNNENFGYIDMLGILTNPEPFLNASGAVIEALDVITVSDADFENNGTVYSDSWLNEGTVLGSGSFCVEDCFQNIGDITGTLDVCDANPGAGLPCDFNMGTIAPTVTMCTNGPCSGTSSLQDELLALEIILFPNPTIDGHIEIKTEATIESIRVMDLMGRTIITQINGDFQTLDLSSLKGGDYLMDIQTVSGSTTKRITVSN